MARGRVLERGTFGALGLLLLLAASEPAAAQDPPPASGRIADTALTDVLARFTLPDPRDRVTAFYDFVDLDAPPADAESSWRVPGRVRRILAAAPARARDIGSALIALLDVEDAA